MDAARDLLQLLKRARQPFRQLRQARLEHVQVRRRRRLRGPKCEGEGDEPLLDPVVQVALQSPAGLIRGRDDARAGGGELGPGVGIRDGGGDELREVGNARLRIRGERPGMFRRDRHAAPQTTLDQDRSADRRGNAELAYQTCNGADKCSGLSRRADRPVRRTLVATLSPSSGMSVPTGT
jgi:hypothetical protein